MIDPTDSYNVTTEADQAHDDKWLADQAVVLGVARKGVLSRSYYLLDTEWDDIAMGLFEEEFVRDWRVAGALVEKLLAEQPQKLDTVMVSYHPTINYFEASVAFGATNPYGTYLDRSDKESAPRAIIEACVEALT